LLRRLATQRPAAIQKASFQPLRTAMSDTVLKLKRVPRRARESVMPNDSASSRSRNQRARMALWTTISVSDPAPKMARPSAAIPKLSEAATITAPITTSAEKRRLERRVPIRSIRRPPTSSDGIAARL
jgi:hypothetical protein